MRAGFRHVAVASFLVLLSVVAAAAPAGDDDAALEEGDQFPAFSLQRSDGSEWRLADHAGKPKLVMFWATWCPYCRKLMPGIVALDEEFQDRGLEVVGVNFRDDGDTDAYAREMNIDFDIVLQGDALAAQAGVTGTPTVFVLDGEDRVVLRTSTSEPENTALRDAVESLMPPDTAGVADPRVGVFRSTQPYASQYVTVQGERLHYLDDGEGQTFLFLHGNPTSSYLWRNVMPLVRPLGRVVALDNIGFGKSARPDLDYTYQTHAGFVAGFIEALDLTDIVLVVHDWGSVLGLDYARQHPDRVRGVVFMEAIVPPAFPMADLSRLGGEDGLFADFRTPEAGRRLLMEQNVFIEQLLGQGALTRNLSEAELNAYRAPFPDADSRFPIYVWPNELPIAGEPARNVEVVEAVGEWLRSSDIPKLLQYASPGAIIPPEAAQWMTEHYPNLEAQFVGYGAHYIQEDNPQAIGLGIADWYRRTF